MDKELLSIYELRYQLLRAGYDGYQVDTIIRAVIGPAIPEEVDSETRQRLIVELSFYLAAAAVYGANNRVNCGVKQCGEK